MPVIEIEVARNSDRKLDSVEAVTEIHVPQNRDTQTGTPPEISIQISTDDIAAKALLANQQTQPQVQSKKKLKKVANFLPAPPGLDIQGYVPRVIEYYQPVRE